MKTKQFTWVYSLALGVAGLALLGPSLASCTSSCEDEHSCNPYEPEGGASNGGVNAGGSSSGKGGAGGKAGNTSGGGDMAQAGTEAGTAGDGGAGGSKPEPCDGACGAPSPFCKESTDACVECLKAEDCTTPGKTKCDEGNTCVECIDATTDCPRETASRCDGGACVKCESNDDCSHIAGKTVCDTEAGECVQCTGKDYAACGQSMGTPLVCDSLKRTCSTQEEHSSGLCQACVSDQQCKVGQLCVKQTFGDPAKDVGYFCFETQAAASGDCTLLANQPLTKPLTETSVDGASATICGLSKSTCTARNLFGKDCATSMAADDTKCGFAPGVDSKCVSYGPNQFLCTMPCTFDNQCPSTCDTSVSPTVCKLE